MTTTLVGSQSQSPEPQGRGFAAPLIIGVGFAILIVGFVWASIAASKEDRAASGAYASASKQWDAYSPADRMDVCLAMHMAGTEPLVDAVAEQRGEVLTPEQRVEIIGFFRDKCS